MDTPNNIDCSAADNQCQHLNATELFQFVLIADNNDAAIKVANFSTILVSEFYIYNLQADGTETYTWYDAVPCLEYFLQIYGSIEAMPETLAKELIEVHNTNWTCPNFPITGGEQYHLQNDPWQYNYGTNLNYVINFCWVSAQRKGITDPGCVTDQAFLNSYINGARVSHKFVRQFFNPENAMLNGTMEYIGENRMESDFDPVITPTNYFLSAMHEVDFYDNKAFDFSSFSFIPIVHYDFYETTFQSFTIYTNFNTDPVYGVYATAISQNPKIVSSQVTLLSFDQTLALIGGYAGTIWMILEWFVGGFQEFAYLGSLLRQLYTTDKRKRGTNLIEDEDKREIEARVLNRVSGFFGYMEFLKAKYTVMCCCCF